MSQLVKIKISASIEVITGLHIGASSAFAAIGATDSPILKDPVTNLPVIPGSSLKGKMRSLLAQAYNQTVVNCDQDDERIIRLFGKSASKDNEGPKVGGLVFRDTQLNNFDELINKGAKTSTEVKFENTINRRTALATPRQIERIIPGSCFDFELIYTSKDESTLDEDIQTIVDGINLLELDYLGGNGSRGYGRIQFKNLRAEVVFGEIDENRLVNINNYLSNCGK